MCGRVALPDETLVVGEGGGIANIVVFVGKASRVHPESLEAALAEPALFDQKECRFLTHVFPVVVGQAITLKNSDPVPHNVNIAPTGDKSLNQLLASDGEVEFAFGRRQSSPVRRGLQRASLMKAYMFPRDDPYVAVSGPTARLRLPTCPPAKKSKCEFGTKRPVAAWKPGRTGRRDVSALRSPPTAAKIWARSRSPSRRSAFSRSSGTNICRHCGVLTMTRNTDRDRWK